MSPLILVAAVTLTCHGAPPRQGCQCLCAPSSTRAAGLIYMCLEKRWYCPKPTATPRAKPHPRHGD